MRAFAIRMSVGVDPMTMRRPEGAPPLPYAVALDTPLRRHLREVHDAADRLQLAAAGMAALAELPGIRAAVMRGDPQALEAGLSVLAAAAAKVLDAAKSVSLGAVLLERDADDLLRGQP